MDRMRQTHRQMGRMMDEDEDHRTSAKTGVATMMTWTADTGRRAAAKADMKEGTMAKWRLILGSRPASSMKTATSSAGIGIS